MSSILNPICRGLVGYVSYLAACKNSTIYSEYLLYEPLLRIAQAQGYGSRCEVPVDMISLTKGDKKRIDFVLWSDREILSIEVKWIKSSRPEVSNDVKKLIAYNKQSGAAGYVVFFGRAHFFEKLKPKADHDAMSRGKDVYWDSGKTKYCAVWFKYI